MSKVKILHLYAEAMDLYGDVKNLEAICHRIRESGNEVTVDTCEIWDDMQVEGYNMVYVGHGKARNLAAVSEHFVKYGAQIKEQIENGQLWFVTGNARALFGKDFTTVDGKGLPGIGLFDYSAVEQNKVFVADMIASAAFDPAVRCYGFANRTAYLQHPNGNQHPLFRDAKGFGDGEKEDGCEGTLYHNFFGTWAMGPVLLRNPAFLKEILSRLGIDCSGCDFALEEQAIQLVLAEFNK